MELSTRLQQGLNELEFDIDGKVQGKLLDFVGLLHKWNRTYNLTAVRKPELMIARHLLDSLVINPYLQAGRILDVGTGAGLPGIPLALVRPNDEFFLLDSNSKKTRFITQVVSELEIRNVTVVKSRVEEFQPGQLFNTIMSRAFSTLANMVTGTRHLLDPKGVLLAMKGVYPVAEVGDLPESVELSQSIELKVPGLDAERHLLIIRPVS
ncbi:MAG: 16S rRNA (guanine(527)-N(7))-methyltransferase RsmG [Gammaproteobacteria bacterium]|jgi:16S rRNA (guanine527-N7)-methyltransferase